jgi:hypothetical protein
VRLALLTVLALTAPAAADRWLHAGIDARTDLGTHAARFALGYRACAWGGTLVVDPMALLDGEHDLDAIAEYFFGPRVGMFAGVRWTTIAVDGGVHQQERSLVGVTGVGPSFFGNRLQTAFSFEIATLWVKHGGGAETTWISWDRNLLDEFSTGIFIRLDYALGM